MRLIQSVMVGSLVFAAACSDPAMEQKVADLEKKVEQLEEKIESMPAKRGGGPAGANSEEEQAAAGLLREAQQLAEQLKYDEAKAKVKELKDKYGSTRAARASQRLESEIAVVGVDAGDLEVEKWFQGNSSMDDGKATLLVFWEVWCPHCKREVPKIQATYDKYNGQGLNIIGLTKMTRNITEDQVTGFIEEKNVSYPIAKEQGDAMSKRFGVRGIPAAAVVKDGKVVWRGHPARLTDDMLEDWING